MGRFLLVLVGILILSNRGSSPQIQAQVANASQVTPVQSTTERPTSFWPAGVEYDPAIPSPEQFFGFDIGVRHLSHSQVASYVKRLAEVSPRITVQTYAQTHGGRPLLLLTITSK